MKRAGRIIIITALMLFPAGLYGFSQAGIPRADSLQTRMEENQSDNDDMQKNQGPGADVRNQTGKGNNNNAGRAVKQVKSGRPDMSKARGARPPSIVRPSGSQVPRGVGKPGGAGRQGGR